MKVVHLAFVLAACHASATSTQPVAKLAEPRASHSASMLADGTVLVTGGFRKGPDGRSQLYSQTTEIFDPRTNRITAGPPLVHARCGHIAVTLADGSILVAGGWADGGELRTAELYDPFTRAFTAVADLTEARGGATATLLGDGRVLVIGGGDDRRSLSSIESFDPATRRWRSAGTLLVPRAGHSATLLADGRILVAGGISGRSNVVASAELFDPATGRSTATGSLAAARYKHGAVALAGGEVFIIAGSDAHDWTGKYATTEIYDPRTGSFRAGPQLGEARFKLPRAVLVLPGGDVAIAGGARSIERIHDGRPRTVAALDAASYFGTATQLPGGDVVVIGGYDDRVRTSSDVVRLHL